MFKDLELQWETEQMMLLFFNLMITIFMERVKFQIVQIKIIQVIIVLKLINKLFIQELYLDLVKN